MPRVNQEEGSLKISRRKREIERVSPRTDSFVYIRVYILYNVSTRMLCHRIDLESSLKMTAPFAVAYAAKVLAESMVARSSIGIYALRQIHHDGSYTRGTKR